MNPSNEDKIWDELLVVDNGPAPVKETSQNGTDVNMDTWDDRVAWIARRKEIISLASKPVSLAVTTLAWSAGPAEHPEHRCREGHVGGLSGGSADPGKR